MSYTVEWNYSRESHRSLWWYGYGADADSPPTVFSTLEEARGIFNMLVRTYYAPRYRIVDEAGDVVLKGESKVVQADRPDHYAHTEEA